MKLIAGFLSLFIVLSLPLKAEILCPADKTMALLQVSVDVASLHGGHSYEHPAQDFESHPQDSDSYHGDSYHSHSGHGDSHKSQSKSDHCNDMATHDITDCPNDGECHSSSTVAISSSSIDLPRITSVYGVISETSQSASLLLEKRPPKS